MAKDKPMEHNLDGEISNQIRDELKNKVNINPERPDLESKPSTSKMKPGETHQLSPGNRKSPR